jgi:hypothetical protein
MMDPVRRNILATGAAATAVAAAQRVFAQQDNLLGSTKKVPFASTTRKPVPASPC